MHSTNHPSHELVQSVAQIQRPHLTLVVYPLPGWTVGDARLPRFNWLLSCRPLTLTTGVGRDGAFTTPGVGSAAKGRAVGMGFPVGMARDSEEDVSAGGAAFTTVDGSACVAVGSSKEEVVEGASGSGAREEVCAGAAATSVADEAGASMTEEMLNVAV